MSVSFQPPPFELTLEQRDGTVVVTPLGELDLATAPDLHIAMVQAFETGKPAVTLDLGGTTFIDSSGIAVVLRAHKRALDSGVALTILPAPARVQQVFEVAGVTSVLRFAEG